MDFHNPMLLCQIGSWFMPFTKIMPLCSHCETVGGSSVGLDWVGRRRQSHAVLLSRGRRHGTRVSYGGGGASSCGQSRACGSSSQRTFFYARQKEQTSKGTERQKPAVASLAQTLEGLVLTIPAFTAQMAADGGHHVRRPTCISLEQPLGSSTIYVDHQKPRCRSVL